MTLIDGFILFVYYLMRQCVVHVNLLEHLICIGDVTVIPVPVIVTPCPPGVDLPSLFLSLCECGCD